MKYSNTLTLRSVTEKNSQQERPDTTSKWFDYECNELKGDYLEDIK